MGWAWIGKRRLRGFGGLSKSAPAQGNRLPAERALAQDVGCYCVTVRAALARFETQGDTLLIDAVTPRDLMDARILLEPRVAA